jgi:hypothetical protein
MVCRGADSLSSGLSLPLAGAFCVPDNAQRPVECDKLSAKTTLRQVRETWWMERIPGGFSVTVSYGPGLEV